ncbi:MAG: M20 family metallopeptidase [Candidatus Heimdallarchaeota archaeon]|nr:M20 family metallopeptidase [Candidatus Heimdallarchaeota archaeon]
MTHSISILKELIRMNTENPPGKTIEILSWIANWAETENIKAYIQKYEENKGNIVIKLGEVDKSILICGHLDTVPIGDKKNWDYDPLAAESDDEYIYGRGSADMKGGVSAILGALKTLKNQLKEKDMKYSIIFLGTSDEEVGLGGAIASLKLGLLKNCEFLIIPEPTGNKVGIAEKGVLWLSVKSEGKSTHGSTPVKGVNAIEELVKLFPLLHGLVPKDRNEILGQSTLNIGVIKGGKSANIVPEEAVIHCDFRIIPPYQPNEFASVVGRELIQASQNSPAKFTHEVKQTMSAIQTSVQNQYVKKFIEKVGDQSTIGLNYGTDGAVLVKNAPKELPFVIFGPGDPKRIHVANERVKTADVQAVEKIFCEFLYEVVTKGI